jgi:competence protein ComEA
LIILSLLALIISGGLLIWLKTNPGQPIEIYLPQNQALRDNIYIGGAVSVPGIYPFSAGDNIETLLQAAGGTTASANLSGAKLYIPTLNEEGEPQKIDINRAEYWLLDALPGIGTTLARRIVDYRQNNGPFRNTADILNVAGISTKTYEQIKPLITVSN